jgi:uncharacterized membrane protein
MTQTTEELLLYITGLLTGAGLVVLLLVLEALHRQGLLLP